MPPTRAQSPGESAGPHRPELSPAAHTFESLWGHDAAKRFLLRALASGRIPHAFLLTGADGIGKRSLALAMAKVILSASRKADTRVRLDAPAPAGAKRRLPEPPPEDDDLFGGLLEPDPEPAAAEPEAPSPAPVARGAEAPAPAVAEEPAAAPQPAPPALVAPRAQAAPPAPAPAPSPMQPVPAQEPVRLTPHVFQAYHEAVCRQVEAGYPPEFDDDGRPTKLGHPDLTIIEPPGRSRSVLVGQIRALQDIAAVPPVMGAFRVAIILGAHTITASAANSLLKLLEEPPSYLLMILVTDEWQRVLPTIRSRTTRLALSPMAVATLAEHLTTHDGLEPALARVAATLAEGRPGIARQLVGTGLLGQRRDVFEARLAVDRLGAMAVPSAAHRALKGSEGGLSDSAKLLLSFARDRLLRRTAPDEAGLLIHGDALELLDAESPPIEALLAEVDRLLAALEAARHPFVPNQHLAMEMALWPEPR